MVIRIFLAAVFLFSGFTKAIDPVASAIKFDEYFISFGMGFFHPISMFLAVVMNIVEFTLGFMLLFKIKVNLTSIGYLIFMVFFFFLTLWLALAEHLEVNYGYDFGVVKDCGCFGQAIEMSNLETFLKNVVLLGASLVVFLKRKMIPDIKLTELGKWTFAAVGALLIALVQVYCYRHLPIIDFSDWKKGNDVADIFIEQPARKDIVFIYRNKRDSSVVNLSMDELMGITDKHPDFYDQYEYIDRKDSIVTEMKIPRIAGFNMIDSMGADHSSELINPHNNTRLFLLFMPDLDEVNRKGLQSERLLSIVAGAEAAGENFVAVTNSPQYEVDVFVRTNAIPYPVYTNPIDPVKGPFMVRDAIRSNPGLIMIDRGIVTGKWGWRDIPEYARIP